MILLIGTDEAGYGPNLGPLVVAASAWLIPDDWTVERLGQFLAPYTQASHKSHSPSAKSPQTKLPQTKLPLTVGEASGRSRINSDSDNADRHANPQLRCFERLPLGDSKLLFQPNSKNMTSSAVTRQIPSAAASTKSDFARDVFSTEALSAGVSYLARLTNNDLAENPANDAAINVHRCEFRDDGLFPSEPAPPPWYDTFSNERLTSAIDDCHRSTRVGCCEELKNAMLRESVSFAGYWYDIVFEDRFNELLQSQGNKASVLTSVCLNLAIRLIDTVIGQVGADRAMDKIDRIEIWSDRHGGRKRYLGWLNRMCDEQFSIQSESSNLSEYRGELLNRDATWNFICKGDRLVPASAASMLAKWIREYCMLDFNRYWTQFDSHLKPTAGYPVDAARFAKDIAPFVEAQKIEKHRWWRAK